MKFRDAMTIIVGAIIPQGYRVCFEERHDGMLHGGFFPDRDEAPLEKESTAWLLAEQFAQASERRGLKWVNIYVINGVDYTPVEGYREKIYFPYPKP